MYINNNLRLEESSLLDQYGRSHQVLADPYAMNNQVSGALNTTYFDKQNVRLYLDRLRQSHVPDQ